MKNRRNFLTGSISAAGIAAGSTLLGTDEADAQNWERADSHDKLIRVGALTSGFHHHLYSIWGPMINPVPSTERNQTILPRMNGMVITHVWDVVHDHGKAFAEKFNAKQVDNYDDMIGEVDAVMICEVWSIDHWPQLAKPYLKAGIPVFFNRPFASSMKAAKELVSMSKQYGTPICTLSSWEYCFPASAMRQKLKNLGGGKMPEIRGIVAYNASKDITHDIHGLWLILASVGPGVESVSANIVGDTIYKTETTTWTLRFKARENNPPFYATLVNAIDIESNAWIKIITDKGTVETSLMRLDSFDMRRMEYFNTPLIEFQKMVERSVMPQTHEHILDKTAVFLAGVQSVREKNGGMVSLDELEDSYYVQADDGIEEYPDGMFQ